MCALCVSLAASASVSGPIVISAICSELLLPLSLFSGTSVAEQQQPIMWAIGLRLEILSLKLSIASNTSVGNLTRTPTQLKLSWDS